MKSGLEELAIKALKLKKGDREPARIGTEMVQRLYGWSDEQSRRYISLVATHPTGIVAAGEQLIKHTSDPGQGLRLLRNALDEETAWYTAALKDPLVQEVLTRKVTEAQVEEAFDKAIGERRRHYTRVLDSYVHDSTMRIIENFRKFRSGERHSHFERTYRIATELYEQSSVGAGTFIRHLRELLEQWHHSKNAVSYLDLMVSGVFLNEGEAVHAALDVLERALPAYARITTRTRRSLVEHFEKDESNLTAAVQLVADTLKDDPLKGLEQPASELVMAAPKLLQRSVFTMLASDPGLAAAWQAIQKAEVNHTTYDAFLLAGKQGMLEELVALASLPQRRRAVKAFFAAGLYEQRLLDLIGEYENASSAINAVRLFTQRNEEQKVNYMLAIASHRPDAATFKQLRQQLEHADVVEAPAETLEAIAMQLTPATTIQQSHASQKKDWWQEKQAYLASQGVSKQALSALNRRRDTIQPSVIAKALEIGLSSDAMETVAAHLEAIGNTRMYSLLVSDPNLSASYREALGTKDSAFWQRLYSIASADDSRFSQLQRLFRKQRVNAAAAAPAAAQQRPKHDVERFIVYGGFLKQEQLERLQALAPRPVHYYGEFYDSATVIEAVRPGDAVIALTKMNSHPSSAAIRNKCRSTPQTWFYHTNHTNVDRIGGLLYSIAS